MKKNKVFDFYLESLIFDNLQYNLVINKELYRLPDSVKNIELVNIKKININKIN